MAGLRDQNGVCLANLTQLTLDLTSSHVIYFKRNIFGYPQSSVINNLKVMKGRVDSRPYLRKSVPLRKSPANTSYPLCLAEQNRLKRRFNSRHKEHGFVGFLLQLRARVASYIAGELKAVFWPFPCFNAGARN